MDKKLKIKLSIADRVYPLTIDVHQEQGLRMAAKHIDHLAKKFEQSYAVRDKQDVLAMCALQFASKVEQSDLQDTKEKEHLLDKLDQLERIIDAALVSK